MKLKTKITQSIGTTHPLNKAIEIRIILSGRSNHPTLQEERNTSARALQKGTIMLPIIENNDNSMLSISPFVA